MYFPYLSRKHSRSYVYLVFSQIFFFKWLFPATAPSGRITPRNRRLISRNETFFLISCTIAKWIMLDAIVSSFLNKISACFLLHYPAPFLYKIKDTHNESRKPLQLQCSRVRTDHAPRKSFTFFHLSYKITKFFFPVTDFRIPDASIHTWKFHISWGTYDNLCLLYTSPSPRD